MHDACAVRVLECGEHRVDHAARLGDGELPLREHLAQVLTVDVLHHDERQPLGAFGRLNQVVAGVEDAHHGGMGHARRGLRLLSKPQTELVVVCELGLHHLDRDGATQLGIGALVDRRHTALADK